jgi:hypothetical protein
VGNRNANLTIAESATYEIVLPAMASTSALNAHPFPVVSSNGWIKVIGSDIRLA